MNLKKQIWKIIKKLKNGAEVNIPLVDLKERHLNNCKLLPNRYNLLEMLPKAGILAEIGVADGKFSEQILKICSPKKMHLVDAWAQSHYGESKAQLVGNKFEKEINEGIISLHRGYSTEKCTDFEDNYFDWIYIDTNHLYKTSLDELTLYSPKLKKGGIIAGHDFVQGNWNAYIKYGVREALYEFCAREDWEFVYLTMEIHGHLSYAIRKIN